MARGTATTTWRVGMVLSMVLLGAAIAAVLLAANSGRVYSVREVEWGLRHDPRHWLGTTVLVRGIVQPFPMVPCVGTVLCNAPPEPYALDDAQAATMTATARPGLAARLFFDPSPVRTNRLLSFAHGLPLLGRLFPSGVMRFSTETTVRVRLLPPRGGPECEGLCYRAVLEGAAVQ